MEQNLNARINEKAEVNHIHEQYAGSAHIHEQYIGAEFVENRVTAAMPPGTVIAYAGSAAPEGFIACNGAAVSRTTYANLFAAIGTRYGAGNGSTTFNLPDLTDRVVQGSATAGTALAAGLPEIYGTFTIRQTTSADYPNTVTGVENAFYSATDSTKAGGLQMGTSSVARQQIKLSAKRYNSIYGNSTTVQPPALTMIYCIKY